MKISLPPEVMEQIKLFCEANKLGFSALETNEFNIFIIGDVDQHVNNISIKAAHLLLQGVVTGMFLEINEEARTLSEKEKDENIPH